MGNAAVGARLRSQIGFNSFWRGILGLTVYGGRFIASEKGYSAPEAARDIFRRYLKEGTESHLLMVDDDSVLAPETITRLASRNLPVVGALTWGAGLPTAPVLFRGFQGVYQGKHPSWQVARKDVGAWFDIPAVQKEILEHQGSAGYITEYNGPEALSRVDAIGFHCVLIRRDVLEAIGEPYCEGNEVGVREDFDFSERAIRAGFDLYVDKSVIAGHTIVHSIRPLDWYVYESAREQQEREFAAMEAQANGHKSTTVLG